MLNAVLRGSTLFSKMIFTIIIARELSVQEFGYWIIITSVITYGTFIVGAELYNVTLRDYIATGHAAVQKQFSAQWIYFIGLYGLILISGAVIYETGYGSLSPYFIIIAALLISEHFTLEVHRIAYFSDHQIHANVVLFIRSAGWMVPSGIYFSAVPENSSLENVFIFWLIGNIVSTIYGLFTYRSIFFSIRMFYVQDVKLKIQSTLIQIIPFIITSIAFRTPFVVDRYLIGLFSGPNQLAAYGYYSIFGNGVQAMFDAIILSRLVPQLLSRSDDHGHKIRIIKTFAKEAILFWLFSIAALCLFVPYLNPFVGKAVFQNYFSLLIIILAGQMLFSLASLLHYGLYALRRDHQLASGAVLYSILAIACFVILIPQFGSYGAAAALAVAASGFFVFRAWQLLRPDTLTPLN